MNHKLSSPGSNSVGLCTPLTLLLVNSSYQKCCRLATPHPAPQTISLPVYTARKSHTMHVGIYLLKIISKYIQWKQFLGAILQGWGSSLYLERSIAYVQCYKSHLTLTKWKTRTHTCVFHLRNWPEALPSSDLLTNWNAEIYTLKTQAREWKSMHSWYHDLVLVERQKEVLIIL